MVEFPDHPIPEEYRYMSPNIISHDQKYDVFKARKGSGDFQRYFAFKDNPHDEVARIITSSDKCDGK